MVVLMLILLLMTNISHALHCITNCTVGTFSFGQPFYIPDGNCLQRISKNRCSISLIFDYKEQTYHVQFDNHPISNDYIYITSGPYLSYTIDYTCSDETNCVVTYAENLYDEMVSRNYDAARIYAQVALYIENPSRDDQLRCYDMNDQIIICLPDEMCALEYDQTHKKIKSRGCVATDIARIAFYDSGSSVYFDIHCSLNLCNDILTYSHIQTIFFNNDLTDENGRRILTAGTEKRIPSFSFLLIFNVISVVLFSQF